MQQWQRRTMKKENSFIKIILKKAGGLHHYKGMKKKNRGIQKKVNKDILKLRGLLFWIILPNIGLHVLRLVDFLTTSLVSTIIAKNLGGRRLAHMPSLQGKGLSCNYLRPQCKTLSCIQGMDDIVYSTDMVGWLSIDKGKDHSLTLTGAMKSLERRSTGRIRKKSWQHPNWRITRHG